MVVKRHVVDVKLTLAHIAFVLLIRVKNVSVAGNLVGFNLKNDNLV